MKRSIYFFVFLLLGAMWFVGCRINDDYEPSPQTIQLETDDFTNWAQARSGRWFTFLISKAIEENPDVPKEELLTVVDSYFGLLLNAQRYYRNQFIHNTGFSATTVDEYLEKQYRVHYPKLDTAINDSTLMETLYQRYLELPTLPVQQSKNKFDKNSLRMGGGEIPTYSCTPPWEMTNFLTLYGGVPIYDDYYFHFFPMTPEEELETIIGKLSWLLIVMPNLHQHTDFLEEFYYLAGNPTMDDYSTVCDGIKAHVSLLIWDYHFLAGTTPDPEDPFPPGGGGPGSGGPGSGDPDPPPFNQNNDCQGALKADEMKIVPGIDSILNTIVNSPYEIGHHFYLSDKADPYSMYIGPARTDSSPSSWSPHYTWDSSNGYAIGSIHNHPGQSPPSPSDALAGIRITEMRLFFPNEVDFLTKNNVTIVVDTTYIYTITIKDASLFEASQNAFDADKQGANITYLNHGYFYQLSIDLSATQREMGEYALMKMYGDAINLTRRSRHGTDNAVVLSIDSVSNNVINYNPCN